MQLAERAQSSDVIVLILPHTKPHPESQQVEEVQFIGTPEEKTYIPPIPRKGDYNGVRLYIEERKQYDVKFKDYCLHHNRKDLCLFLTKEFGWFVDDKSLGRNIQRNI